MVPPFFADGSRRLPHEVQSGLFGQRPSKSSGGYSCNITVAPVAAYSSSAKSGSFRCTTPGCIQTVFPCASHLPAAFCRFLYVPTLSHPSLFQIKSGFLKPLIFCHCIIGQRAMSRQFFFSFVAMPEFRFHLYGYFYLWFQNVCARINLSQIRSFRTGRYTYDDFSNTEVKE